MVLAMFGRIPGKVETSKFRCERFADACAQTKFRNTACGGRGLRIVYGFLPDVEDEACGLFTDLYRIWGRRLADC